MRVVHADETPWIRFSSHRPGHAQNKRLLSGAEGEPDNFELSIVDVDGDYATPAHKHNFDQFRYMLKGRFGYGKGLALEEGSLSYFPEGTPYTQQGLGESSHTLLLQFGGASGAGFMSYRQLEQGKAELDKVGVFKDGVWEGERAEGVVRRDAYQAIWEHMNNRALTYPAQRYSRPVVTDPRSFAWVPTSEEGVEAKMVGRFSERDVGMGFYRVKAGAAFRLPARSLLYLLAGGGTLNGEVCRSSAAIDPQGANDLVFSASTDTEMLFYDRPLFNAARQGGSRAA